MSVRPGDGPPLAVRRLTCNRAENRAPVGRFEHAYARVAAGDTDYFTKPLIGSYHDVWMELHEDLLTTLGIERKEGET